MSPTFCWELATAALVIAVGLLGYVIAEQRRHRAKLRKTLDGWTATEKRGVTMGNPRGVARVTLRGEGVTAEELADDRMPVDDSGCMIPYECTGRNPVTARTTAKLNRMTKLTILDRLNRMVEESGNTPKHVTDISPGDAKAHNKDPHDLL